MTHSETLQKVEAVVELSAEDTVRYRGLKTDEGAK